MKHVWCGFVSVLLVLSITGCSAPSGGTHQTSTPPPPVPGATDPQSRPVIYDSTTGGPYTPPPASSSSNTLPSPTATTPVSGSMVSYTVQSGDSLWKIARQHGTSVDRIRAANNLTGDVIRPGQVINIPTQ